MGCGAATLAEEDAPMTVLLLTGPADPLAILNMLEPGGLTVGGVIVEMLAEWMKWDG